MTIIIFFIVVAVVVCVVSLWINLLLTGFYFSFLLCFGYEIFHCFIICIDVKFDLGLNLWTVVHFYLFKKIIANYYNYWNDEINYEIITHFLDLFMIKERFFNLIVLTLMLSLNFLWTWFWIWILFLLFFLY